MVEAALATLSQSLLPVEPVLRQNQIDSQNIVGNFKDAHDNHEDIELRTYPNSNTTLNSSNDLKKSNASAANLKWRHFLHSYIPSTWWGFEIAAMALSFASFVAIIVVLRIYENRPQEAWPYNHLTLNGLIALLSTITRGSLFVAIAAAISQAKWTWFTPSTHQAARGRPLEDLAIIDEASRGTLGSLKLLWITKGYHLAAIGAVLTLMAVAFDTFIQQVLTVRFRNDVDIKPAQTAYFPRSEYYSEANNIPFGSIASTTLSSTASLDMQAAVTSGILAVQVDDVAATCSTGNCTFPIIPTIGVCGGCTNITEKLKTTCNDDLATCSHTLPSGLTLTLSYNDAFGAGSGNVVWFTSQAASDGVYKSGQIGEGVNEPDQETFSANPMYVANFEAINTPYLEKGGDYTEAPIATQCALWFCMQAFNVSVTSNRQTQNITSTYTKLDWLADQGIHKFTSIPLEFNVAPGSTFTIDKLAVTALQQSFNFSQSITEVQYGNAGTEFVSSPSALGLWHGSQDWNSWIAGLARSISNNIRTYHAANLTVAPAYAGTTLAAQSFVDVRWAWLAYPAAMLLLGLVFFVASVWQSKSRGVSAWKDGPLTLLAGRLEEDVLEDIRGSVDRPDGVAQASGTRRMVLQNDDGLLTFRHVRDKGQQGKFSP